MIVVRVSQIHFCARTCLCVMMPQLRQGVVFISGSIISLPEGCTSPPQCFSLVPPSLLVLVSSFTVFGCGPVHVAYTPLLTLSDLVLRWAKRELLCAAHFMTPSDLCKTWKEKTRGVDIWIFMKANQSLPLPCLLFTWPCAHWSEVKCNL